jgi:hypothetical protein
MPPQIHWRAPTTIAVALVLGLASAIGHHAFYRHLNQQAVDSSFFGQQINIAIGTAFAFLFRASLVIAIGAIYWQIFWATLLRSRKSLTVAHVDTLSGALGSIFELANVRAMMRSRTLAALALLSWLIPLAALLPPATLSIQNLSRNQTFQDDIPVLNTSAAAMFREHMTAEAGYRLSGLVTDVAFRGAVRHASGYLTNTTYALQFAAPALQCRAVASQDLEVYRVFKARKCRSDNHTLSDGTLSCALSDNNYVYDAWSPWDAIDWVTENEFEGLKDVWGNTHLLVGTRPFLGNHLKIDYPMLAPGSAYFGDWALLNCSLHSATYNAIVSTPADAFSVISNVTVELHGLVSDETWASSSYTTAKLGYYVMMKELIRVLAGYIIDSGGSTQSIYRKSDITQTKLIFTKELMYSARAINVDNNWTTADLPGDYVQGDYSSVLPEEAWAASTFNASLAVGIEDLFRNITLSLFSNPFFMSDSSEAKNVSREWRLNVYTYRQRNLLLSYGIAISGTLLACVIGCMTIYRNNASFSNKFSTIIRTTKLQLTGFDELLTTWDQRGADPLPKHLATAQFELGGNKPGQGNSKVNASDIDSQQDLEQDGERSVMLNNLRKNGRPSNAEDVERDPLTSGMDYSEQYSESTQYSVQRSEVNGEMDVVEDWPTSEQWRRMADGIGEPRTSAGSYQNSPM